MKLQIEHYGELLVTSNLITESELQTMQDADSWAKQVRAEAERILEVAKQEAEKLKLEATSRGELLAKNENAALLTASEEKINEFFNSLESEIFAIIYRVMNRLGFEQVSAKELKHLIQMELNGIVARGDLVIISANSQPLEQLKLEFGNSTLQYQTDESLTAGECIYETEYYRLKIDIELARDKIRQYLSPKPMSNVEAS